MFATVICIILFASPLSTMKTVIAEKNAASILAPLTLCQVTNCLMWTVYGFIAAKDVFVWGPNGTGLILGLNDELLGFILLTIPAVIFSQFFYAQKDEGIAAGGEDDDSGLSL